MERPILFSGSMVKAILAGNKTMTRRVIKSKTLDRFINLIWNPNENLSLSPYQVGDILWVRETWNCLYVPINNKWHYWHKAGDEFEDSADEKWRPSIFMPKVAARLFLKVKDIRVERVQDITEEDAISEGIEWSELSKCAFTPPIKLHQKWPISYPFTTAKEAFKNLWDSINSKRGYGWDLNPWVWVVEFSVTKGG